MQNVEALLGQMRETFLSELGERCDQLENLVIQLENASMPRDLFDDLYRRVHSLKGSGGTHGVHIVSVICHQLENLLTEAANRESFSSSFSTKALAHIDLLRKVEQLSEQEDPDYDALETELEKLREPKEQQLLKVLVAEPSSIMQQLLRKALADQPVHVTMVDDGIAALELLVRHPFDVTVMARELVRLNGIAVAAALRASKGRNANIPFILLTSNPETVPKDIQITKILPRDRHLMDEVTQALTQHTLSASPA